VLATQSGNFPQTLRPFWPEEACTVRQAASRAGKSVGTIRVWSDTYFLGRPIGPHGARGISKVALEAFLNGDVQALTAYLEGDRSRPEVVGYYERLGLGHLVKRVCSW
jgi:hypothetical protein